MIEPFDTLQRESPVITGAPWMFSSTVFVATSIATGIIHWIYRARLENLNATNSHLKESNEELKEKIEELRAKPPNPPPQILTAQAASRRSIVEQLGPPTLEHVTISTRDGCWHLASESTGSLAVIVSFHYSPDSTLRGDLYVKAHLSIADVAPNNLPTIVPATCWLGERLNQVVLSCGDKKSILLLTRGEGGRWITAHNQNVSHGYFDTSPTIEIDPTLVSSGSKNVTVTLMDDGAGYKQSFPVFIPENIFESQ